MDINATLIGEVIAFAIIIAITMKFIWPPILAAIEERQKKIAEGLEAADRARKELADANSRADDEVKKARAEAAGIIERANQQAGQIVDKAREELRGKVASLAVAGAEKILHREIDAGAHKALIDELVAEI